MSQFSPEIWEEFSNLTEWEYRVIQDFILRVNMRIKADNMNFVFKDYDVDQQKMQDKKYDMIIAMTKRTETDTVLTDVMNRLVIPDGVTWKPLTIWGMDVVSARNLAVTQALKHGAKYILFVDDDIIAPNNALLKIWNVMHDDSDVRPVVSALYPKKVEPLVYPFAWTDGKPVPIDGSVAQCTSMVGMGFCLLNIEYLIKHIPLPLFWAFSAPDGLWSMGEDAFFTKNIVEMTDKVPLVDTSIKCLHMDKKWNRVYGIKDPEVEYATNVWETGQEFTSMRQPVKVPTILVGIPTRSQGDPVAVKTDELLMFRGYNTEIFRVWDLPVDLARERIADESLKRGSDYVLFIDDDVIPPIDGATKLIEAMEKSDCDVVAGNYLLKGPPYKSAHLQMDEEGKICSIDRQKIYDGGQTFKSNWLTALGFALVKTEVFKQMRRPWFKCFEKDQKGVNVSEDAHFTELSITNGFNICINPSVECLHVDFKTKTIYGKKTEDEYATFDELGEFKFHLEE